MNPAYMLVIEDTTRKYSPPHMVGLVDDYGPSGLSTHWSFNNRYGSAFTEIKGEGLHAQSQAAISTLNSLRGAETEKLHALLRSWNFSVFFYVNSPSPLMSDSNSTLADLILTNSII